MFELFVGPSIIAKAVDRMKKKQIPISNLCLRIGVRELTASEVVDIIAKNNTAMMPTTKKKNRRNKRKKEDGSWTPLTDQAEDPPILKKSLEFTSNIS